MFLLPCLVLKNTSAVLYMTIQSWFCMIKKLSKTVLQLTASDFRAEFLLSLLVPETLFTTYKMRKLLLTGML